MYLSKLTLNPRSNQVLHDLSDPYQMHKTVLSGFPERMPVEERVLFRVELQRERQMMMVLVQSHTLPDWEHLSEKTYVLKPAELTEVCYEPHSGETFRFRLAANPTKRLPVAPENRLRADGKENLGKRIGLFDEDQQIDWLKRKGQINGFEVLSVTTAKMLQPDGWKVDKDGKKHCLRQLGVCFDGRLLVTDAALFARAWLDGIGSGKGMGFGLLSLAPDR